MSPAGKGNVFRAEDLTAAGAISPKLFRKKLRDVWKFRAQSAEIVALVACPNNSVVKTGCI